MNTGHLLPIGIGLTLSSVMNVMAKDPGTFVHSSAAVLACLGAIFMLIGFVWRQRNERH